MNLSSIPNLEKLCEKVKSYRYLIFYTEEDHPEWFEETSKELEITLGQTLSTRTWLTDNNIYFGLTNKEESAVLSRVAGFTIHNIDNTYTNESLILLVYHHMLVPPGIYSGSNPPSYSVSGTMWYDLSSTPVLKIFDGFSWFVV